ncbi:AAA family ATPase [Vulcanisaeta distributa]|uniref:ATPase n=1 Tax=Vulcanisaeta distributa (strain DSM 14429 / JCM 11212 / NBRC 100878 / IC-017) TaxID=572478 RepID=E1QP76_VULDI|nr:ATP-binding protein [Vulcanisaeta distributa]ADN50247.1 ATPase [Vulcanisaeta distributa DSM 14429]
MLFSTEPKTSLDELFDREAEIERFRSGLNERLVLVLGIRRVGKSSLVLSVLNSLGIDYIFIDVRKLYDNVSRKVPAERIYNELRMSLGNLSFWEGVRRIIDEIDVSLGPIRFRLSASRIRDGIAKILEAINNAGKHVVLILDEAQYLRYSTIGLRPLLAYVYDHLRNITLVLTGSEVGLLHDFLGINDPSSELYGRYYHVVELRPFDRGRSIEFLRRGFRELGINVDDRVIERAADELGGIVGWLVYFGRLYPERGVDAINEVKEIGANLVRSELEELFSRSQYYRYIMEAVAVLGRAKWSDVMKYLMARVGERPTNATLSRDLNNLVKMGFLTKDGDWYGIPDPIVRYAVLRARYFTRS